MYFEVGRQARYRFFYSAKYFAPFSCFCLRCFKIPFVIDAISCVDAGRLAFLVVEYNIAYDTFFHFPLSKLLHNIS